MCVRVVICRCEEDDVEMRVTARRKEGGRKAEEGGRRRTEGGGRDGSQKTRTPHRDVGNEVSRGALSKKKFGSYDI